MQLEQGDLFGMDAGQKAAPPPKKPYAPPTHKKTAGETTKPTTKPIDKPPQRKNLTYADYLEIHCGNKLAANYWYMRNEGRSLK